MNYRQMKDGLIVFMINVAEDIARFVDWEP